MRIKDFERIELSYPRQRDIKFIHVGLSDVRATDDIRISYDFDRDGWLIEQATVHEWIGEDNECDPKWKESAFIPEWQYREEGKA